MFFEVCFDGLDGGGYGDVVGGVGVVFCGGDVFVVGNVVL